MKVGILGSGAYGIALASILVKNNVNVIMWCHSEGEKELLVNERRSSKLKNYNVPKEIEFTTNIEDVITIKAKGDSKLFEVLNMLYELCPGMSNLKIDGFSVEGKKDIKIDEMKTVSENKLDNNSILIINSN